MTEEQSKGYRGCPTGMHFAQHDAVSEAEQCAIARTHAEKGESPRSNGHNAHKSCAAIAKAQWFDVSIDNDL